MIMAPATPRISVDSFSTTSPLSPNPNRSDNGFPRSGSSGRPTSSSSRFRPRRSSTASSIHSVGGSLDTASSGQQIYESGQNAISTLLQPPIVRTGLVPHTSAPASSAHKPPTARDIPPVNLSSIPHLENSEFTPYLNQVGALYDALQRAKDDEGDGAAQSLRKAKKMDEFSELFEPNRRNSGRQDLSRQGSIASLSSLQSSIESTQPRRRSSKSRQTAQAPAPLSTVPSVYFEDDFHLENPRTFDVVSERSEVVKPVPGIPDEKSITNGSATGTRKALATNSILQEKLSWYMDTVEIHLISSISSASSSFFAALGSLRDLHSEAAESVNRIKALRQDLGTLDRAMALAGLEVIQKRRKRENLRQLGDSMSQLQRIMTTFRHCETLVNNGDICQALDAIHGLEQLILGKNINQSSSGARLRDLRNTLALQGVTTGLETLRYRIGKAYEMRLLTLLVEDLKKYVDNVTAADVLQRWSSSSQRSRGTHSREPSILPAYTSMRPEFRSELFSILSGLDRATFIIPAIVAFRDALLREVRNIMRRYMPSSNDDDADSMISTSTVGAGKPKTQRSSILARNLRALDAEDAEKMLKHTYISVGETMRRLGTQVKVLLDVTSMLGEPPSMAGVTSPPRSPHIGAMGPRMNSVVSNNIAVQDEIHQILDMSNLLGQAVDIAQDKIVRILKVRSEQSIHLPIENFLRYFTLNLLFANECEAVSGRSGTILKSVVNGHIKEFVHELGERERQTLAHGMEADPWNANDFNEGDKEHLDRILASSTHDVEAWTSGSKVWLPLRSHDNVTLPTNGGTVNVSTARSNIRPASINTQSFILPASAILCLHGLSNFLHLLSSIPSFTIEISSIAVSYLALFNSRCTQLILGAGATRSAGLKNITTKHLALTAQALSFIGQLVPNVRECVRRHAPTNTSISQTMSEFDRVRRMIGEHESSIFDKFGEIMRGRGVTHVKTMRSIEWTAGDGGRTDRVDGAADGGSVNKYMETLVKDTSTLHKVLSKHFPRETVEGVMKPVFAGYRALWGPAFEEVALGGRGAWERLLRDAVYFSTRLTPLDGAGDTGEYLVGVVRAREPAPPQPAALPATSEETDSSPPDYNSDTHTSPLYDSTASKARTGSDRANDMHDSIPIGDPAQNTSKAASAEGKASRQGSNVNTPHTDSHTIGLEGAVLRKDS